MWSNSEEETLQRSVKMCCMFTGCNQTDPTMMLCVYQLFCICFVNACRSSHACLPLTIFSLIYVNILKGEVAYNCYLLFSSEDLHTDYRTVFGYRIQRDIANVQFLIRCKNYLRWKIKQLWQLCLIFKLFCEISHSKVEITDNS